MKLDPLPEPWHLRGPLVARLLLLMVVAIFLPIALIALWPVGRREIGNIELGVTFATVSTICIALFARLHRSVITITRDTVILNPELSFSGRRERLLVPLSQIASVESRVEYVICFGVLTVARGYGLVLKDGRLVELGPDDLSRNWAGGRYWPPYFEKAAAAIANKIGHKVVDTGKSVTRKCGGAKRSWDAEPVTEAILEMARRRYRRDSVVFIIIQLTSIPALIIAVWIIGRIFIHKRNL